jgi:hypothetical protein
LPVLHDGEGDLVGFDHGVIKRPLAPSCSTIASPGSGLVANESSSLTLSSPTGWAEMRIPPSPGICAEETTLLDHLDCTVAYGKHDYHSLGLI